MARHGTGWHDRAAKTGLCAMLIKQQPPPRPKVGACAFKAFPFLSTSLSPFPSFFENSPLSNSLPSRFPAAPVLYTNGRITEITTKYAHETNAKQKPRKAKLKRTNNRIERSNDRSIEQRKEGRLGRKEGRLGREE
jgi:hypothetical protein